MKDGYTSALNNYRPLSVHDYLNYLKDEGTRYGGVCLNAIDDELLK